MRTIVESIKNNTVNESTNVFNLDALSVKDLYDLIKNNEGGDLRDILDDISDIIDMDNTTDREDRDIIKLLELIRDHCLIIGPEGGYDGNGMGFYDVLDMYKLKVPGLKPGDDVDDDYGDDNDFDYIFGAGMAEPLPRKWLAAIKNAYKFNCKYASYYIISGYEFPCIICFDVINPLVKKFATSIEAWG